MQIKERSRPETESRTATMQKKPKKPRLKKTPKSERKAYRTVFDDVGLLVERPTSTLWFERGALAKVRAEQQIIIRATRTDFIFIDAEGAQHGVLEDEDTESETSEDTEPGQTKEEEAQGGRTSRQDSAAGAIPIDWSDPGIIDFDDIATRRACVAVLKDFFNKKRYLVPQLLFWLH